MFTSLLFTLPPDKTYVNKKLFSFLKNANQDSKGVSLLKAESGQLLNSGIDKANIIKKQFESVFTSKTPIRLSQLSQIKVKYLLDEGRLAPSSVPTALLVTTM